MAQSTYVGFLQNHTPALTVGDYEITVSQSIGDGGNKISQTTNDQDEKQDPTYTTTQYFTVAGERFYLNPKDIAAQFPPPKGIGDFSNVLPHLRLSRSTLPWERQINGTDTNTPWLALLVFSEEDKAKLEESVVALSKLETGSTEASPYFPAITLETGQQSTDKANVVDIPISLLSTVMPSADELALLAHNRVAADSTDSADSADITDETYYKFAEEPSAILVANRLPEAGMVNYVYLVSLENRFNSSDSPTFDYQNANLSENSTDKIRLVYLSRWSFTSTEHYKIRLSVINRITTDENQGSINFSDTESGTVIKNVLLTLVDTDYYTTDDTGGLVPALTNAGLSSELLEKTGSDGVSNQSKILTAFAYGDFATVLKQVDHSTLRLPNKGTVTENFLKMGLTAKQHLLRSGEKTASWYRGPFIPTDNSDLELSLPALSADKLTQYYEGLGMLDVSYSAAWEIGRLLALQNKSFAISLYQWKRTYLKQIQKQNQSTSHSSAHLPKTNINDKNIASLSVPTTVSNWLADLRLLKGIPFNYLVPDEALLPVESIRFFNVDNNWLEAVTDGAFAIGRASDSDYQNDKDYLYNALYSDLETLTLSGFLLRSEAVSGWPDMQIEAFDQEGNSLDSVRVEQLSSSIMLCIFQGSLDRVELHLNPEILHYGLTPDESVDSGYVKYLRDNSGSELTSESVECVISERTLDIAQLKSDIDTKYSNNNNIEWADSATSAELAVQMLEGVEKVIFQRGE
ncbi:hypothetical protein BJP36_07685 [Moorena producens JHB]|uniref:Uncharacterized protein n=1 Tax=Moorena producens (strain JHB) TaxID=1454205 RepID=A0A1D9FXD8_MOOP1|nr:hypothetical protein [Moorena producens]AOY79830.1 hypothetical protein BJP36_07685 [Moorena producens JHB]